MQKAFDDVCVCVLKSHKSKATKLQSKLVWSLHEKQKKFQEMCTLIRRKKKKKHIAIIILKSLRT